MTLEEKKMEFVVFCIENVAEQLNELPENIYSRLNNLGLIDVYYSTVTKFSYPKASNI